MNKIPGPGPDQIDFTVKFYKIYKKRFNMYTSQTFPKN